MFNWFNNTNSPAPAAVTNPATTAGAVTTGGATAAPTPSTATGYAAPTPEVAALGDQQSGTGSFANTGEMVIGGITALGNLWNAYQQNKLAKDQFNFQKNAYKTSLADNRQTYNSALEDRIRSRYNTEGRSSAEADAYLDENRLG